MKILTLVSEYPSYENEIPNTFVHKILKELQNNGAEVYVLLMDFRSIRKKRKWGLSSYEYDGIKVYRYAFPCGPIPYALQYLSRMTVNKLYKYAQKFEGTPDIIHAHFGTMAYLAGALKKKHHIPYIVTEHSSSLMTQTKQKNSNHKFFFQGYENADKIVAVSNSLKNAIVSQAAALVPVVVPNILGSDFKLRPEIQKEDVFTVISAGRLIQSKRYDLLISTVACLVAQKHRIQLWIVGDGDQRKSLEDQARELGVLDSVVFWGTKKPFELCELFNRSHVFALPSEVETFGVVYIEANACGLPIVATDCGGPSDIVNEGNGLIIPQNDNEALAKAILSIKMNYDKFDPSVISDFAIKKYGKASIISQYFSIYGEVIDEYIKKN